MNPDPTARITYYWRDDDGATATPHLGIAPNLSGAGAYAVALAPLLKAVSNCALQRISVGLRYLDTNDPVPMPESSVYRRTLLIFETASGGRFIQSLPGLRGDMLLHPPDDLAGIALNLNHVAIAALVAAFVTGIGGVAPCAPWGPGAGEEYFWDGDDVVGILAGYWGYERETW
jgi:hypothetical protein